MIFPRIDAAPIRRGALFLINVGVPVVIGAIRDEPRGALLGAIGGMILSFADNDGAFPGRLRLLLMAAACIVAGGVGGHWLRDTPEIFWPTFIIISFAVGMAARAGREPLIASRDGTMAFAVGAGLPAIEWHEINYLVGAFILTVVSRGLDHLLAGPLPGVAGGPKPQVPSGRAGWLRFSLGYAMAATGSFWIGTQLDPTHTIWIVTTTLVVMQVDARASYRRILERIGGTLIGIAAAWAITATAASAAAVCIAIIVIAPFIPHHVLRRYWLHTALIALMILLAYDLIAMNTGGIEGLLEERLQDMLIGCAVAAVGTFVAFPHWPGRRDINIEPDELSEEDTAATIERKPSPQASAD